MSLLPDESQSTSRLPSWVWAVLGLLVVYQGLLYAAIMRVTINVTTVLMPYLLRQPGYRLYENVILQHAPKRLEYDGCSTSKKTYWINEVRSGRAFRTAILARCQGFENPLQLKVYFQDETPATIDLAGLVEKGIGILDFQTANGQLHVLVERQTTNIDDRAEYS